MQERNGRHGTLFKNRAQLGKFNKALVSVVLPHPAVADSSKRRIVLSCMHHAVVDADGRWAASLKRTGDTGG
ncbi:MAG: hypothetical protein ACOYOS_24845 [Syntrophales bacterium]